jgi:flagellar biogenesis protein FliO
MSETTKSHTPCPWTSSQRLLAALCVGGFFLAVTPPMSRAAEPPARQSPPGETTQNLQEQFLQHFISQSLQPEAMPPGTRATQERASVPTHDAHELTAAATKMILSLGVLILLLIGGAYLVRRYLLQQPPLGRRGQVLRVVAQVPLTPKTAVALVEVPGKVLVVGVAGTVLTALGEVAPEALGRQTQEPEAAAFAATLDRHVRDLEAQQGADDVLLHVPEAIQKKVNGLKRL